MEDLTKLSPEEARRRFKEAGIGSIVCCAWGVYTIVDFDKDENPIAVPCRTSVRVIHGIIRLV